MTDDEIRRHWNRAKTKQLEEGYATQADRRIAKDIRDRQANHVPVTPEQLSFAEAVENCE